MNEITTKHSFRCDLNAGTLEVTLDAPLMHQDALGDVFIASVWHGSSPVDLTGVTARGYLYLAATQQTVLLDGTANGSTASVTLDSSCYAVPGHAALVIQLQQGNVRHTVLKVNLVLDRTCTDTVIDPSNVLPTLPALLAQITAMEQATAEAYAAVDSASIAKGAIEVIDSPIPTAFISGKITNGGTISENNTRIRSAKPILITGGMRWHVDEPYRASVAIYNGSAFTSSNFAEFVGGSTSAMYVGDITIPAKYIGKYMGIRIEKYGHEEEDISGDLATIGEHVKLHDMSKVLSASNHHPYTAEDFGQFLPIRRASSFDWEYGQSVMYDGREGPNAQAARTVLLEVSQYTTIVNRSPDLDHMGREFHVFVAEYDAEKVFVKRTRLYNGHLLVTAENTVYVRLLAIYPSPLDIAMSAANLLKNFDVGFVGNIVPGDGQRPVYVAFGASTTVGAVHHMDNKSVTYTHYAFPDYIGQILGLETYNLGNGTTGFMARDSGYKPNFMDAIYNNDELLKKADLITLMFGYGNDGSEAVKLPFGSWDDYFPYDTFGSFFVPGNTEDNKNGIADMVGAGATLMGCLNWCIRWIGTHYPQATLVCLFGAPSGNADYPVNLISNTDSGAGTYGVPQFKISVNREESETDRNAIVDTLRKKLNIPIINLFNDGLPFSYYNTTATNDDGTFAVFSTKGTADELIWNSHPNETGYLMYARYLAGRVSAYFKH